VDALYTPSLTLRECRRHPAFTYRDGLRALSVRRDADGRACAVVAAREGGARETIAGDRVVLAAGALCSTEIFLRSIAEASGDAPKLGGLMDNRQILVPFLTLRMLGKPVPDASYQYHVLGMGVETGRPDQYVHGQVTTLTSALLHPIIQRLPLDLRSATLLARATHAALGVVNVNLHDTRRADNTVSLDSRAGHAEPRLTIRYRPAADQAAFLERVVHRVRRALWGLGAIVPPGMTHVRPMGASVHYAGTLPMTRDARPWTTTPDGESRDIPGLYLADGATFPFLPAKNITFSLMANAVRIAAAAF
jgi:choline dehydrogenase-like flavoprotein